MVSILLSLQAVCFAHLYSSRILRIGLPGLMSAYVLPSVLLGLVLNIPRILEHSLLGQVQEQTDLYLESFLVYQVKFEYNHYNLNFNGCRFSTPC